MPCQFLQQYVLPFANHLQLRFYRHYFSEITLRQLCHRRASNLRNLPHWLKKISGMAQVISASHFGNRLPTPNNASPGTDRNDGFDFAPRFWLASVRNSLEPKVLIASFAFTTFDVLLNVGHFRLQAASQIVSVFWGEVGVETVSVSCADLFPSPKSPVEPLFKSGLFYVPDHFDVGAQSGKGKGWSGS